ncbi:MAG: hypothetical protein EOR30_27605 [Mesorhizobium sp.]|uniref:maleate cis-trans isomerase family protein n=1 Tax=Mesorhizobium sp. TaxID=1871066 RepID=UPI000FEA0683|nr:hypothetical protein [Mesorhizobium sp.]RWF89921.1 MAG: hypothetical protein EOQ45_30215 [Mesorhizobium sp.]RWJ45215.1 MAG: hypothetical protein EOR30_27605 [Mesorhizobium sp.]RWJ56599.1 MAG: hypothetical protein EOR32_34485 [Mesorhizobium sp.]RWJ60852.1 MAG: hypothetical protein EOR34_35350 [Mesorhizobium sp.]RWJ91606.1 MAG: hypothetical protein EOR38_34000 [Mesorhizobium sp.]
MVDSNFSSLHVQPLYPAVKQETIIGLIVPSNDNLTELELRKMLDTHTVSFSATRFKHEEAESTNDAVDSLRRHQNGIAEAATFFEPPGDVNVFVYACTSGSAIISQDRLEQELHRVRPNALLTSPMTGALRAFERLGTKSVSMLTPYVDEVGALVADCVEKSGVAVRDAVSFHCLTGPEIFSISPESIYEAASAIDLSNSDALFIPCTFLRTLSVIDRLEDRLGKPVVTAHQAMLWDALRLVDYQEPISGFGRLLTMTGRA